MHLFCCGADDLGDPAFQAALRESGRRNIFFIRTSAEKVLNPVDSCAVASAVEHNPDANVMLLSQYLTCKALRRVSLSPMLRLVRFHYSDAFASTPGLAAWFTSNVWKGDFYRNNLGNALRLALLFDFGGSYFDTDMLSLASTADLSSYIAMEREGTLNNAALSFPAGHPYVALTMERFVARFRRTWGHNGPALLTHSWSEVGASLGGAQLHNTVHIRPQHEFYGVPYAAALDLFSPATAGGAGEKWLQRYYADRGPPRMVHLWNKRTKGWFSRVGKAAKEAAAAAAGAGAGVVSRDGGGGGAAVRRLLAVRQLMQQQEPPHLVVAGQSALARAPSAGDPLVDRGSGGGEDGGGGDEESRSDGGGAVQPPPPASTKGPLLVEVLMTQACPAYLARAMPLLLSFVGAVRPPPPILAALPPVSSFLRTPLWLALPAVRSLEAGHEEPGTHVVLPKRVRGRRAAAPPSAGEAGGPAVVLHGEVAPDCGAPSGTAASLGCGVAVPLPFIPAASHSWTLSLWMKAAEGTTAGPEMCPALACAASAVPPALPPPGDSLEGEPSASAEGEDGTGGGGGDGNADACSAAAIGVDGALVGVVALRLVEGNLSVHFPGGGISGWGGMTYFPRHRVPDAPASAPAPAPAAAASSGARRKLFATDSWRHLAIVYTAHASRRAGADGVVRSRAWASARFLIDGMYAGTRQSSASPITATSSPQFLLIGGGGGTVLVDGVSVYATKLNEQGLLEQRNHDVEDAMYHVSQCGGGSSGGEQDSETAAPLPGEAAVKLPQA